MSKAVPANYNVDAIEVDMKNTVAASYRYVRITNDFENELYAVERSAAYKLHEYLRTLLRPHDLGRHTIRLVAVNERCRVTVDGEEARVRYGQRWYVSNNPLIVLLREMELCVDARFAKYLHERPFGKK